MKTTVIILVLMLVVLVIYLRNRKMRLSDEEKQIKIDKENRLREIYERDQSERARLAAREKAA
jgi:hypothetical protein